MSPFNHENSKVVVSSSYKQEIRNEWSKHPERKLPDTRELIIQ